MENISLEYRRLPSLPRSELLRNQNVSVGIYYDVTASTSTGGGGGGGGGSWLDSYFTYDDINKLLILKNPDGGGEIQLINDDGDVIAYSDSLGTVPSFWDGLPIASATQLGGIKVGANLTIDGNGVLNAEAGGGTGGTWGSITGLISDQTDLQHELDDKSDITHNHTGVYEPANSNIQSHIGSTANPHNVTYSQTGAQVAGTYNTIIGTDSDINTSGATIIDNLYMTDGVLTSHGTRILTTGDIGALAASHDMTLTLSGDASGSATFTNMANATLSVVVANDSHTHDGRYYTESESNSRFVNTAGDTMTGNLQVNANISATGEITAYSSSDKRLKTNVFTVTDGLAKINALRPVRFNWNEKALELNENKSRVITEVGLIAQEAQEVVPEIVGKLYDDYLGIKYDKLTPFLVSAIQELSEEINALKLELTKLKKGGKK